MTETKSGQSQNDRMDENCALSRTDFPQKDYALSAYFWDEHCYKETIAVLGKNFSGRFACTLRCVTVTYWKKNPGLPRILSCLVTPVLKWNILITIYPHNFEESTLDFLYHTSKAL